MKKIIKTIVIVALIFAAYEIGHRTRKIEMYVIVVQDEASGEAQHDGEIQKQGI